MVNENLLDTFTTGLTDIATRSKEQITRRLEGKTYLTTDDAYTLAAADLFAFEADSATDWTDFTGRFYTAILRSALTRWREKGDRNLVLGYLLSRALCEEPINRGADIYYKLFENLLTEPLGAKEYSTSILSELEETGDTFAGLWMTAVTYNRMRFSKPNALEERAYSALRHTFPHAFENVRAPADVVTALKLEQVSREERLALSDVRDLSWCIATATQPFFASPHSTLTTEQAFANEWVVRHDHTFIRLLSHAHTYFPHAQPMTRFRNAARILMSHAPFFRGDPQETYTQFYDIVTVNITSLMNSPDNASEIALLHITRAAADFNLAMHFPESPVCKKYLSTQNETFEQTLGRLWDTYQLKEALYLKSS